VGGKYVGGRSSVVSDWGTEGEGEDGREWMRRGRESGWEVEQWIVAQEKKGK
jgi:hypothetical protein